MHKRSEQGGASKRVSGASKQVNGRASSPLLQSVFLAVLDHSGRESRREQVRETEMRIDMEKET